MKIHTYYRKIVSVVGVLLLVAVPTAFIVASRHVVALDMSNRSITVSSAIPSAQATHVIGYNLPTTNNVGSLLFEYCENTPLFSLPCTPPVGFSAAGTSLVSQTLNTGFSVDVPNSNANRIVVTRASAAGILGSSSIAFANITNPSDSNKTVFLRLSSHASADATGPVIDQGAFAYSTSINNFNVGVFVPPYLTFCVGVTVATDCSSTDGSLVAFGEFSSTATRTSTTQFAVATNDFLGYNVFLNGQTMTAGNNIINPLASQTASTIGTSQFGMNLKSNSSPSLGAEVSGVGTGTAQSGYNTSNQFRFADGDRIASSSLPSDFNRFTASYIVNVARSQPPGIYATTLSYSAVVSF